MKRVSLPVEETAANLAAVAEIMQSGPQLPNNERMRRRSYHARTLFGPLTLLAVYVEETPSAEPTAAPLSPVDATDWSHRAPLENWYEDYSSDFEES
jgi:hypothetical protein